MFYIFFFFFFQAEDGIRDLTVTGVQTCALPISRHLRGAPAISQMRPAMDAVMKLTSDPASSARKPSRARSDLRLGARPRSEERRVGKECRSRWSPYQ